MESKKKPVTMSLRVEDLARLDEFAGARRLTRGDAVGVLLESYGRYMASGPLPTDHDPDYIPPFPNQPLAGSGSSEGLSRIARAQAALIAAQKKAGVHPTTLDGENLKREFDEEAERNLEKFYASKGGTVSPPPVIKGDWEEPP